MQNKKTLYWILPKSHFGKDVYFVNSQTKEVDVALGHRLNFLIYAFLLSIITNNSFNIFLEKEEWPESKFIKFPSQVSCSSLQKEKILNSLPLTNKEFLDIFIKRNFEYLSESSSFRFDCIGPTDLLFLEMQYHETLYKKYNKSFDQFKKTCSKLLKEINNIKLCSAEANKYLNNKLKGHSGLYVRRTHALMTMEDINTLPENIREDFILDYWQDNDKLFKDLSPYMKNLVATKFISDEIYFQRIDKILKTNPEQKFYLSYNVKTKYLQHYKDKYPGKIINREDLLPEFLSFFGNDLSPSDIRILTDLLDLFSLCNCENELIYNYHSFWIMFAEYYRVSLGYDYSPDQLYSTMLYVEYD